MVSLDVQSMDRFPVQDVIFAWLVCSVAGLEDCLEAALELPGFGPECISITREINKVHRFREVQRKLHGIYGLLQA